MVAISLTPALNLACSVFGIRTAQEPSYAVVLKDGQREVRRYPSYVVARTRVAGDLDRTSNPAFRRLFNYISGNNDGKRKLEMTAPVIQRAARSSTEVEGVRLPMTAPVIQSEAGDGWVMEFIMPAEQSIETLPRPLDPTVTLAVVEPRHVAVVRFSGTVNAQDARSRVAALTDWASTRGYRPVEARYQLARYDPPFTLPFLRRNEIQVTVRRGQAPTS